MRGYVFSLLHKLALSDWLWPVNKLCDDSLVICLSLFWFSLKVLPLNILGSWSTRRLCDSKASGSWWSHRWVLILFRIDWNILRCCLIQIKIPICKVCMCINSWLRNMIAVNILRILNSICFKCFVGLWLINALICAHRFSDIDKSNIKFE